MPDPALLRLAQEYGSVMSRRQLAITAQIRRIELSAQILLKHMRPDGPLFNDETLVA